MVIILGFEPRDVGSIPSAPANYDLVGKMVKPPDFQSGNRGFESRLGYQGTLDRYGDGKGCNPFSPCGSAKFDSLMYHQNILSPSTNGGAPS